MYVKNMDGATQPSLKRAKHGDGDGDGAGGGGGDDAGTNERRYGNGDNDDDLNSEDDAEDEDHSQPAPHSSSSSSVAAAGAVRPAGLTPEQMSAVGLKVKRVLDQGRVLYLRGLGLQAHQVQYCSPGLSPECYMILATHPL